MTQKIGLTFPVTDIALSYQKVNIIGFFGQRICPSYQAIPQKRNVGTNFEEH